MCGRWGGGLPRSDGSTGGPLRISTVSPGARSGWFLFGALSLTDRVVAMGDAKTRKCVWCEKEFTRRSLWRAKRYCKRRHQYTHYGAILVGSLFS